MKIFPLRSAMLAAILLAAPSDLALAAGNKTITTMGTGIAIALPIVAAGISIYKDDWTGVGQLGLTTVATVGTAYSLKQFVRERRPDGSDFESFPSDTTALAASGSSYLWKRYGWEYGLPAFVATQFVSYSRIDAKKHHWYDTLASSALAIGYSQIFTSRFQRRYSIYSRIDASPEGAMMRLSYTF